MFDPGLPPSCGLSLGLERSLTLLWGFGGGEASVYSLYHVSEGWLLARTPGLMYGLWATLCLLFVLLTVYAKAVCRRPETAER